VVKFKFKVESWKLRVESSFRFVIARLCYWLWVAKRGNLMKHSSSLVVLRLLEVASSSLLAMTSCDEVSWDSCLRQTGASSSLLAMTSRVVLSCWCGIHHFWFVIVCNCCWCVNTMGKLIYSLRYCVLICSLRYCVLSEQMWRMLSAYLFTSILHTQWTNVEDVEYEVSKHTQWTNVEDAEYAVSKHTQWTNVEDAEYVV
jgi:hypothetical protein